MDALRWLAHISRIVTELDLGETDRVIVAAHFLEGEAESWWDVTLMGYTMQASWSDFLREFRRQYPAPRRRAQMAMDFYQLTQGDSSVEEFDRQLRRLYRALPQDDRTEALLVQRFVEGLRAGIRANMSIDATGGYDALVVAAVRAEAVAQPRSAGSPGRDPGA